MSEAVDTSPVYDQLWRLSNLYRIQDKDGFTIAFYPNDAQLNLYNTTHGRDIVLKARQHGFTTFIDLWALDDVLFNHNFVAAIVAHNYEDAKRIFRTKVRFPFEHLDPALRAAFPLKEERADELVFEHGSSIRVATSARSGTTHFLHVSEMGKIAAQFPDKAREVRTGSFESVPLHGRIFIESTAEGAEGDFYELSKAAVDKRDSASTLTPLDFNFHFYAWWMNPDYQLPARDVVIVQEYQEYFDKLLAEHGVYLSAQQRAWYVKKAETLDDAIKSEYPSTWQEAFETAVEGAYYSKQMTKMRLERRISRVPYDPSYPVYTLWDLGLDDSMSIWFAQRIGLSWALINYYENSGEGIEHYANVLANLGYVYERHVMPHDSARRSVNSQTDDMGRVESVEQTARRLGLSPLAVVQRARNMEEVVNREINAVRRFLGRCYIDEEHCRDGIRCLDNYRREYDERLGSFKRTPLHNWACHGADALRNGVKGLMNIYGFVNEELEPEPEPDY